MKTLKILNAGLLVIAAMCAVIAVFAFVKGDIMHGVLCPYMKTERKKYKKKVKNQTELML